MTSVEHELERTVLERKERDELVAIAQAMELKPGSRARKADIINVILSAAGLSGGSEPPSPPALHEPEDAHSDGVRGAEGADESGDQLVKPASRRHSSAAQRAGQAESLFNAGSLEPADEQAAKSPGADQSETGSGSRPKEHGDERDAEASTESGDERDARSVQDNGQVRSTRLSTGQPQARTQSRLPQSQSARDGSSGEPGNRKGSRRRRGRERGERDLQGQSQAQEGQFSGELVEVKGLLDLRDEGYGFVRSAGYLPSAKDAYVSISQARRFALRKGDYIEGACRPAASNEKYPALIRIDSVSGLDPEMARQRPRFEDLTPLFPDSKLRLEVPGDPANMTARIVDLLAPIGKGQRGLIVSPPKAGKTTVMKQVAHSIEINNPEVHLMVLLVDERPEEVTDMSRSVTGEGVASTFDRPSDEHTTVAELAIERAKRLVEMGRDVVIILDGITRLARAYNLAQPATGRIMSGGVDSGALYPPKKFFGAARNIEEGGSLTILATALVETGSKMDEVIFEEFKGTGNMELRLDRKLAERRIYPAIDVNASSTRHEELLFDRSHLQQVWKLRRVLNALGNDGSAAAGLELLMDKIRTTKGNDQFLAEIAKGPNPTV